MFMNGFVMPAALALSAETLQMMWQTPLLGMGMIFAILSLLWLVLAMFKLIFARPEKKKKAAPVAAPAPVVEEPVVEEASNDDELVAVITAAVAAYMAQEEPDAAPNGFRVVSFRRTNGGKAWNSK